MLILESFTTLLQDPAHWAFEFLVGGIEELFFGVIVGVIVWPRIKRHFHADIEDAARTASGGWTVTVTDNHEGHDHGPNP